MKKVLEIIELKNYNTGLTHLALDEKTLSNIRQSSRITYRAKLSVAKYFKYIVLKLLPQGGS